MNSWLGLGLIALFFFVLVTLMKEMRGKDGKRWK